MGGPARSNINCLVDSIRESISLLVGEMPGRAEGGASGATYLGCGESKLCS
ncbi:UNVERIFIED_ORG: hypothetical protein GGE44_003091 [Rhizobium esperanzae]